MGDEKPLLVFLNATFQACRARGTSAQESGLKVSAEKQQDEIINFYHADSNDGRKCLNVDGEGKKICDYLVFYSKDKTSGEVLCFLELKGSGEEDAIKQILSTHDSMLALLKVRCTGKQYTSVLEHLVCKACICLHGHTPTGNQRAKETLSKRFGRGNVRFKYGVKHYKLLAEFLRE